MDSITPDALTLLSMLQISDTGFPTGGFSHSVGVESAEKHGVINDIASYKEFLTACLENTASQQLAFVSESHKSHGNIENILKLDTQFESSVPNHVANRASQRQGRSFTETCSKTFSKCMFIALLQKHVENGKLIGHFPVVYGAACADIGITLESARAMFMYNALKNMVAATVRLGRIGPLQAQNIQQELQQHLPDMISRNENLTIEEVHIKFPTAEIIQNVHDTMFSKLFYS